MNAAGALIPFVFGHGLWLTRWRDRVASIGTAPSSSSSSSSSPSDVTARPPPPALAATVAWHDAVALDVLDPAHAPFFERLRVANAHAFGDIGMPAWVQLDCATLPTAMIGFARRARDLAPSLRPIFASTGEHHDDDLMPVAEYCALPTPVVDEVVGFSLFSLEPGLGLRAKAMALLAYGARRQLGMTQRDNTALKTHCRLGVLDIVQVGVAVHSRPLTTLVYRLNVPDEQTLAAIARGELVRVPTSTAKNQRRPLIALQAGDRLVDVLGADGLVVDD